MEGRAGEGDAMSGGDARQGLPETIRTDLPLADDVPDRHAIVHRSRHARPLLSPPSVFPKLTHTPTASKNDRSPFFPPPRSESNQAPGTRQLTCSPSGASYNPSHVWTADYFTPTGFLKARHGNGVRYFPAIRRTRSFSRRECGLNPRSTSVGTFHPSNSREVADKHIDETHYRK